MIPCTIVNTYGAGAIFIFISAAAPNKSSVGATNGLCQVRCIAFDNRGPKFYLLLQVIVSITRGVGPAVASSLFSLSMAHNLFGGYLVYYIFALLVGVALLVASKLPRSL
jgi:hypothetical protein